MSDLIVALALVLVIEGSLYALFPAAMQRMMRLALEAPSTVLSRGGLAAAVIGVIIVWAIRG